MYTHTINVITVSVLRHSVALVGLELIMYMRLTSNSQRSAYLCLLRVGWEVSFKEISGCLWTVLYGIVTPSLKREDTGGRCTVPFSDVGS